MLALLIRLSIYTLCTSSLLGRTPRRSSARPVFYLRGGGATLATSVYATVQLMSGVHEALSPHQSLNLYGVEKASIDQVAVMRMHGAAVLVGVTAVIGGAVKGAEYAAAIALYGLAISVIASAAPLSDLGVQKHAISFFYGYLLLLSMLGSFSMLEERRWLLPLSPYLAASLFTALGIQIHCLPLVTLEMHSVSSHKMSAVAHSLYGGLGAMHLALGFYLAVLTRFGHDVAIATLLAVGALFAFKWAMREAGLLGVPRVWGLVWAGFSAALGMVSLL